MRKSSFIIAMITGILIFGIPIFSFAAEDVDSGSYVTDPEVSKAISDYISTHPIVVEEGEDAVSAYEEKSQHASGRLWFDKPALDQRAPYGSTMNIQFRTKDHWANYYTLPTVTILNANLDEVETLIAKKPAVKNKTSGYNWTWTLKVGGKPIPAGKYYIGVVTLPCDSAGNVPEDIDGFQIPTIVKSFYIVPSGKVIITNSIEKKKKKTNNVIWDKSKVKGASNYQISWRAKGGKWTYKNVGNTIRGTSTGLTIGQLYEYRVRPYGNKDSKLYGSWSNLVYRYFHTTERIRLASKNKGSFTISWKNNPKATKYQVMFTTNRNGSGAAKNINNIGKGKTSFTKTGLRSGVIYYVQIREVRNYAGKNWIGNISKPIAIRVR